MDLRVIFDGSLSPATVAQSQSFTGGQFLLFNSSELGPNEGLILGMSIVIQVPVLFGNITRIIPTPLLTDELTLTLDTNLLYPLPREVSESGYPCFVYLNSADVVSDFIVYVVTSDVSQESLKQEIDLLRQEVNEVKSVVDQILLLTAAPVPMMAAQSLAPAIAFSDEFWDLRAPLVEQNLLYTFSPQINAFILYSISGNSDMRWGDTPVTIWVKAGDVVLEEFQLETHQVQGTEVLDKLYVVSDEFLTIEIVSDEEINNLIILIKPIISGRTINADESPG